MTNPTKQKFNPVSGNFDLITDTDAEGLTFNAPIISNVVPVAPSTGQMWFNSGLNVKVPGGTLQVGEEMYMYVINKTGVALADGKFIYTSGVDSGYPKAILAQANTLIAHNTLAMTTNIIGIDAVSNVTTMGLVHDLDTTVDSDGNALAAGDMLYLSALTPGGFTKIEPYAPNYSIKVGSVIIVDATVGEILVDIEINNARDQALITKDPTGFDTPELMTVTYDPVARTVTLGGTFIAYWRGAVVTQVVTGHVSAAHDDVPGSVFYYYFNGTSVVWTENVAWSFDVMMIAIVQYGATDKFAIRECHGLMDWRSHQEFHRVIGTYRSSGGALSAYTLTSTSAPDRRPDVASTTVYDEDLPTVNAALTTKLYTKLYLTGTTASPVATFTVETAEIIPVSGAIPYYNQLTGGNWQQTLMADNQYQAMWLIAVPVTLGTVSQQYRYLWMQGQSVSTTLTTIQSLTPADLVLGNLSSLSPEYVFITKLILRYDSNGPATWQIISVTNLLGNRFIQSAAAAGVYLSAVEHDDTLSGDGSATTPLSVVYSPTVIVPITSAGAVDLTLYKNAVYVCSNAADIILDLSTVAGGLNANSYYVFKNINPVGGFKVTLNPNGSETINGSTTSWDLWPQDSITLIVYGNALLVI